MTRPVERGRPQENIGQFSSSTRANQHPAKAYEGRASGTVHMILTQRLPVAFAWSECPRRMRCLSEGIHPLGSSSYILLHCIIKHSHPRWLSPQSNHTLANTEQSKRYQTICCQCGSLYHKSLAHLQYQENYQLENVSTTENAVPRPARDEPPSLRDTYTLQSDNRSCLSSCRTLYHRCRY